MKERTKQACLQANEISKIHPPGTDSRRKQPKKKKKKKKKEGRKEEQLLLRHHRTSHIARTAAAREFQNLAQAQQVHIELAGA